MAYNVILSRHFYIWEAIKTIRVCEVFTFMDELEAFEHLWIYCGKKCFFPKKKLWKRGRPPPSHLMENSIKRMFFLLKASLTTVHILRWQTYLHIIIMGWEIYTFLKLFYILLCFLYRDQNRQNILYNHSQEYSLGRIWRNWEIPTP